MKIPLYILINSPFFKQTLSQCSKKCGNGIQRRHLKCLEVDKTERVLRESKNCKYSERPNAMRYCNSHDCSGENFSSSFFNEKLIIFLKFKFTETTTTYDPRVDMIQSDDPKCRDEFPNCQMVLKSKLCGYHYYNENCCQSCRMISNELY
jgi:hypothetical protein